MIRRFRFQVHHVTCVVHIRLMALRDEVVGQDLIEYALMAGFVAVAGGVLLPTVASSISTIFSRITSMTTIAATVQ